MSAGANCKFHGLFGSFAEITAQVRAGTQYPPEIGDTARYRLADGTLGECSFGPSGWRTDKEVTPSGDVQFGGLVASAIRAPVGRTAAPLLDVAAQNAIAAAFCFTQRFKVPPRKDSSEKCIGFDVAWFNGGSEASVLGKAAWSVATSLTVASAQVSPALLQINGVDIANGSIPAGTGGSEPEVMDLLVSDFVNKTLTQGQVIEIRSNLAAGANHTYNKHNRGTDAFIAPVVALTSSENTGVVGTTGDGITTNPSVTCVVGGWYYGICFVRFYFAAGTVSILNTGDSVIQGIAGIAGETGNGDISPLSIAAQLDPRISPAVFAHGNWHTATSHKAMISLIPKLKPAVALIWCWSPNDGAAGVEAAINRAVRVAQVALENGAIPAMCTPIPWEYTAADLVLWQAGVARVRAMCAEPHSGMLLVDVCAALEDPANPGKMLPAYKGTAVDGQEKHPGPVGKMAFGQAIVDGLKAIL